MTSVMSTEERLQRSRRSKMTAIMAVRREVMGVKNEKKVLEKNGRERSPKRSP